MEDGLAWTGSESKTGPWCSLEQSLIVTAPPDPTLLEIRDPLKRLASVIRPR